jgi:hypothetical protein
MYAKSIAGLLLVMHGAFEIVVVYNAYILQERLRSIYCDVPTYICKLPVGYIQHT